MGRAKGEGMLTYKASRGLWVGRWQGREVSSRNKATAAAKLKALREAAGIWDERATVADYLTWWIDKHLVHRVNLGKITESTREGYEKNVRLHLMPPRADGGLGDIRLGKLRPEDVEALFAAKLKAGYAPRSVQYMHATLRNALNTAVRRRLIASPTPAHLVEAPTVRRTRVEPLTVEEARSLLRALRGDPMEAFYLVAIGLGLRLSEVLGLHWRDVDLERGTARIRTHLVVVRGEITFGDTKTHQDVTLPLPRFVIAPLRAHRQRQLEWRLAAGPAWWWGWAEHDLVFTRVDGRPLDRTEVWKNCRQLCERAGIPPRGPHQLARHGCATLLRQQGASLEDVRDLLRHARISTTEIYAHVTQELRRETADRLDAVFGQG